MSDRLSELRELEAAATPGPWNYDADCASHAHNLYGTDQEGPVWLPIGSTFVLPDAALIAATRNALPDLLDVAEAARDVAGNATTIPWSGITRLRAALSRLDGDPA